MAERTRRPPQHAYRNQGFVNSKDARPLRILGARWCNFPAAGGAHLTMEPAAISVLGHERDTPVIVQWNTAGPDMPTSLDPADPMLGLRRRAKTLSADDAAYLRSLYEAEVAAVLKT